MAACGINGVLSKEAPRPLEQVVAKAGRIDWMRRDKTENGVAYRVRCREFYEAQRAGCLGLAFSASGSLGLVFADGAGIATAFRCSGCPLIIMICLVLVPRG